MSHFTEEELEREFMVRGWEARSFEEFRQLWTVRRFQKSLHFDEHNHPTGFYHPGTQIPISEDSEMEMAAGCPTCRDARGWNR